MVKLNLCVVSHGLVTPVHAVRFGVDFGIQYSGDVCRRPGDDGGLSVTCDACLRADGECGGRQLCNGGTR